MVDLRLGCDNVSLGIPPSLMRDTCHANRVMTVSFHKYGDYFFPGTGELGDVGERAGKYYSINVPMRDGTDDATFHRLFKPIMSKVMEVFQPGAIVLQCGRCVLPCPAASSSQLVAIAALERKDYLELLKALDSNASAGFAL